MILVKSDSPLPGLNLDAVSPPRPQCAGLPPDLLEAVEAADAEAPGPAANAVTVGDYGGAETAAADGFVVEEGHGGER